jgi:voltage-gated potassium channel
VLFYVLDQIMATSKQPRTRLLSDLLDRLIIPLALLVGVFLIGTLGYLLIGGGRWSLLDTAYMTSITLTTVGYGEVLEAMGDGGRVFTIALMWSGMAVTLYSISAVTAFVVERHLNRYFRERKMQKRIAALREHVIICGAGKTGGHIIREFAATERACCVVDVDPAQVSRLREEYPELALLQGDATEEDILRHAGIERALGIIANLHDDSRNLLITVMARFARPDIKIVARVEDQKLVDKFQHAGANYIVNPSFIGGMRMASEMLRPHVVTFLDKMLRGPDPSVRMEESTISGSSRLIGKSLREADILGTVGLQPIAVKSPETPHFIYNPPRDLELKEGTVLVVIGSPRQLNDLRRLCC